MLKQVPEDFIVREKAYIKLGKGDYSIYLLRKKDINTLDAAKAISKIWNIGLKKIGYSGTKDRHAVTEQYISIFKGREENIAEENFSLEYLGKAEERLALGDLECNEFKITVRNIDKEFKVPKEFVFVNYFDEQRFSRNNFEIGKAILKKDYGKANEILGYDVKKTDKKMLLLYINSVSSYLWNEMASQYVRKKYKFKDTDYSLGKLAMVIDAKYKKIVVPMIGFGTEFGKEIEKIADEIMTRESITPRDFILRDLPGMGQEGYDRELFVKTKIQSKWHDDELNEGKKKLELVFSLPKGSYATMLIKSLIA